MSIWDNKWLTEWLEGLGKLTLLAKESVTSLFTFKASWKDLLYQIYFVGVKSQSVVLTHWSVHGDGARSADIF